MSTGRKKLDRSKSGSSSEVEQGHNSQGSAKELRLHSERRNVEAQSSILEYGKQSGGKRKRPRERSPTPGPSGFDSDSYARISRNAISPLTSEPRRSSRVTRSVKLSPVAETEKSDDIAHGSKSQTPSDSTRRSRSKTPSGRSKAGSSAEASPNSDFELRPMTRSTHFFDRSLKLRLQAHIQDIKNERQQGQQRGNLKWAEKLLRDLSIDDEYLERLKPEVVIEWIKENPDVFTPEVIIMLVENGSDATAMDEDNDRESSHAEQGQPME